MRSRFDAIVVGAGFGGVTSAAVLASRGYSVLVLDKNRRPGGKAMRVRRNGTVHDMWPISGGPANLSRFHDLAKLIGCDESDLIAPESGTEFIYLRHDGKRNRMRVPARAITNPLEMIGLIRSLGVPPTSLPKILALTALSNAIPEPVLNRMDRISMKQWVAAFKLPPSFADLLLNLQNLFYVAATDRVPASEGIRTLREIAVGGAGRYHRGGYGMMAEKAIRFVQENGGIFMPGVRVEKILTNKKGITGVATSKGNFSAPVVISNAGIQPTVMKLAAGAAFPPEYETYVQKLEPSWAFVGTRYELSKPLISAPMTIVYSPESGWDTARYRQAETGRWPRDPLLLVTVPSLYDPELGTQETPQVVLAGVMSSPDPDSPMARAAIEKTDEMMARVWPGFMKHVKRKQSFGAAQVSKATRDRVLPAQGGECIGLAQVIGQCGRSKPSARSPIKGLYFVGCDAGGRGIGTTQAVDSGFNVAEMVLADNA